MPIEATLKKLAELTGKNMETRQVFLDRIITVATGALAFSVTFRGSIAGSAGHLWLLKVAWIAFGVVAICGALMHLAPISARTRLMRAIREDQNARASAPNPVFYLFWYGALIGFPIGVAALVLFGVLNL